MAPLALRWVCRLGLRRGRTEFHLAAPADLPDLPDSGRPQARGRSITALVGLFGSYLFATRFTKSIALRGLVVALFMYNGRWALQASVGHGWHLQYAYMPLALFFFDQVVRTPKASSQGPRAGGRGHRPDGLRRGNLSGPPYGDRDGDLRCRVGRRVRRLGEPLAALCSRAWSALGLAAPKMLPIVDLMRAISSQARIARGIRFQADSGS